MLTSTLLDEITTGAATRDLGLNRLSLILIRTKFLVNSNDCTSLSPNGNLKQIKFCEKNEQGVS
ncbi:hypothetical protein Bhyg_09691 [Pseudolycoriella hygida]|uniref:Uncharacterized protein n=1 Tax=Pseudolycoriella hygida TaxID=35572 RepID=A0A9Q0MTU4_9DIPT|nr:hypothetical protein Bhyg_09691 [Pseudolycoriella hygida]